MTICTRHREPVFGSAADGDMHLNWRGRIVQPCWQDLPNHHPRATLDSFVVMPNHIHGIIVLNSSAEGTAGRAPPTAGGAATEEAFGKPVPGSLPTIVRSFKAATTKQVNEVAHPPGAALWQPNFYEHVVRDGFGLNRIREYIDANPLRWSLDRENPDRQGIDEFDRWLASPTVARA